MRRHLRGHIIHRLITTPLLVLVGAGDHLEMASPQNKDVVDDDVATSGTQVANVLRKDSDTGVRVKEQLSVWRSREQSPAWLCLRLPPACPGKDCYWSKSPAGWPPGYHHRKPI